MASWPTNGDTDWNTKMLAFLAQFVNTSTGVLLTSALPAFGTRTSPTITDGANVQVSTDGYLTVWFTCSTEARIEVYSDSAATPTTLIASFSAQPNNTDKVDGITVPIVKDDYYRVDIAVGSGTLTGVWLPIGVGV
jgi:hypothetical protein